MNDLDRLGMVLYVTKRLRDAGSWDGETHVQKSTYLLQELGRTRPDWSFMLYKHGPYSFELHDDIIRALAIGLLVQEPSPPYGPRLELTDAGEQLLGRIQDRFRHVEPAVDFVAPRIGPRNVFQLEQVATAVMVTREMAGSSVTERADRLRQLKPHVDEAASMLAVTEADTLLAEAATVLPAEAH